MSNSHTFRLEVTCDNSAFDEPGPDHGGPGMKQPLYYGVKAYGFPGHCFPSRFVDSCRTLTQARQMAKAMHRDGWRTVDVMRELPRPAGHVIGAYWETVETIGA